MSILTDPLKLLAALFLFIILLCALFVSVWDLIHGTPIPAEASTILSAGIGYSLTALGFSHASDTIGSSTNTAINGYVRAQEEGTRQATAATQSNSGSTT